MQEVLKKLRRGEIKIRKSLNTQMQGGRHSLFKGSGLEFDDVRPYQYGDDVRSIHWAVSSKGHGIYVKTFREEREQVVFLLVDVSASQKIGPKGRQKLGFAQEVAGTLLLSAATDSNQVGMLLFGSRVERLLKPQKGPQQAYKLIHALFQHRSQTTGTKVDRALRQTMQLIKRKSIIILISDFIDEGYTDVLKSVAQRHDLILLHIQSPQERQFPALGILPVYEPELKKVRWINTQSKAFVHRLQGRLQARTEELRSLALRQGADYLALQTDTDYVVPLIELFRSRNRRRHAL